MHQIRVEDELRLLHHPAGHRARRAIEEVDRWVGDTCATVEILNPTAIGVEWFVRGILSVAYAAWPGKEMWRVCRWDGHEQGYVFVGFFEDAEGMMGAADEAFAEAVGMVA